MSVLAGPGRDHPRLQAKQRNYGFGGKLTELLAGAPDASGRLDLLAKLALAVLDTDATALNPLLFRCSKDQCIGVAPP